MKLSVSQRASLWAAMARNSGNLAPQVRDVKEWIEREFSDPQKAHRPVIKKKEGS